MLTPPKLMFFKSVASQFDQSLVQYQIDKLMVLFLCRDLDDLLQGLCKRFVNKSVLGEANTPSQLVKLALANVTNHLTHV